MVYKDQLSDTATRKSTQTTHIVIAQVNHSSIPSIIGWNESGLNIRRFPSPSLP